MLCMMLALMPTAGAVLGFCYGPRLNRALVQQYRRMLPPKLGFA